jgi:hypothetical protein
LVAPFFLVGVRERKRREGKREEDGRFLIARAHPFCHVRGKDGVPFEATLEAWGKRRKPSRLLEDRVKGKTQEHRLKPMLRGGVYNLGAWWS